MPPAARPDCIAHYTDIEKPDNAHYKDDDELLGIGAPFGRHFGLKKLGIHHVRLLPGRRSSYPHAESDEEEYVYVIEGTPDVWLDGHLHRLKPGDGVGFPSGTGLSHSFLNNTDETIHLLVVGEATKPENRIYYPKNPEQEAKRQDWWSDVPQRPLGEHDGMPDKVRAWKARR